MSSQYDVAIVGAGMVGAAAASLLARAGFSVALVEGSEPQPFNSADPVGLRVSALSPGSARVLAEAGAWRLIQRNRCCPYRHMVVEDRDETASIEFQAQEFGLEELGSIVENDLVQWSLWQALQVMAGVEFYCPDRVVELARNGEYAMIELESGATLQAALVVGADGAGSRVRELLGISQEHWEYGQMGLVGIVQSRQPNPGVAWQRFMEGGPVAFLPLKDGTSSIVWSQPESEARRLIELDEESFLTELEQAVSGGPGHWPGELKSCGPRAIFPLTMRLSERYSARRAVLIGDAAHVTHPLAGQGVNLGLMDAAGLVESLVNARRREQDFGSEKVLLKFDRWRRSEAELMCRGVHGIRGLFMPEEWGALRRIGLGVISRSWTAREAFIRRATGSHRNAPALARGQSLVNLLQPG